MLGTSADRGSRLELLLTCSKSDDAEWVHVEDAFGEEGCNWSLTEDLRLRLVYSKHGSICRHT